MPAQQPHHHHQRRRRRPHQRLRHLRTPTPGTTPTPFKPTASTTPSPAPPHHQCYHRQHPAPEATNATTTGNQQTTKPAPEETRAYTRNHQQQHPHHQSIAQEAIHNTITSGTHTTGATDTTLTDDITRGIACNTLINGITSGPHHLLHKLAVRANGTSQRPTGNKGSPTPNTSH